jgi:phosphohistidine phosphatase
LVKRRCNFTILVIDVPIDLYILRHGDAEPLGLESQDDAERSLTSEGLEIMTREGQGMHRLGITLDVLFSSPKKRARQTAQIVHEELSLVSPITFSDSIATGSWEELLVEVDAVITHSNQQYLDTSVMIVGHEPYLGQLIGVLTTGMTSCLTELVPGSMCKLRLAEIAYKQVGTIQWLLTPDHLQLACSNG